MQAATRFEEMSFEAWEKKYKPITNHIDENASFQNEDGEGIMFETYGDELDFVKSYEPNRVWTLVDGEENAMYIYSGYHYINRIGYFLTKKTFPLDTEIQVVVAEPHYLCENCEEQWFDEAVKDLHYEQFSDLGKCAKCATMEELKQLEKEYGNANI